MAPAFTVRVPNDGEGEGLGEYESYYLPRVGESFAIWHPRLCRDPLVPFLGVVTDVTHEAYATTADGDEVGIVSTVVWLSEEGATPTLYCDCSPEERWKHPVVDGHCDCCRGVRKA